uniref:Uncharacterized protein n=1 Tax=Romanomermis culicivorax TaxID=13658 RepID=A0A915J1T1_ROMCU
MFARRSGRRCRLKLALSVERLFGGRHMLGHQSCGHGHRCHHYVSHQLLSGARVVTERIGRRIDGTGHRLLAVETSAVAAVARITGYSRSRIADQANRSTVPAVVVLFDAAKLSGGLKSTYKKTTRVIPMSFAGLERHYNQLSFYLFWLTSH